MKKMYLWVICVKDLYADFRVETAFLHGPQSFKKCITSEYQTCGKEMKKKTLSVSDT